MENRGVKDAFNEVLELWEQMKTSGADEAAADADRFQMKFYEFIDQLGEWVKALPNPPSELESAKQNEVLAALFEEMPGPLQIPFETELELILEGTERMNDSTELS